MADQTSSSTEVKFQSTGSVIQDLNILNSTRDELLQSIAASLLRITDDDGVIISQSSLSDLAVDPAAISRNNRTSRSSRSNESSNRSNVYQNRRDGDRFDINQIRRRGKIAASDFFDELTDAMEDSFIKGLFGSKNPIQTALAGPINEFAKSLGVDVKDLSKEVGKRLGSKISEAFKNTPIGDQLNKEWHSIVNGLADMSSNVLGKAADFLKDQDDIADVVNSASPSSDIVSDLADEGMEEVSDALKDMTGDVINAGDDISDMVNVTEIAETSMSNLSDGMSSGTEVMSGLMSATSSTAAVFPLFTVLIGAGILALKVFGDTIDQLKEDFKQFGESYKKVGSRVQSQYSKNVELFNRRMEEDAKTLIRVPFDILEQAANKALDTWDAVLTTITATQGIDKAGLQELWEGYAKRLQDEGLSSVVSSADIMSNLKSVIDSGLSGSAAEEFAYLATVLNNAIPTQDFFQYANTYASLAANAMQNGADEEAAINSANEALKDFASNILYANREIAGGLTTSLSNASSLFEDAAKIAVTSRGQGNVSEISAVLTSVSALVGSIAPDLASGIVDSVVKAAIGGNSDDITALRSMTSVGASNTAFLQALARDPQKVFSELFANLAEFQNMSADNYMEVAEGLSSVFGISMDAFARVDFNYLAKAISAMNVNNTALEDNLELLKSGQTTLTSGQLRMQQVNKYMIEEGLAYVLDNEVAREVQRHMWEEQLAREIENATYAVEVQGLLLDLVQGILNVVNQLLEKYHLDTFVEFETVGLTALESNRLAKDLKNVLEYQKVGEGRAVDLNNLLSVQEGATNTLMNGNRKLDLIDKYPELIGLTSSGLTSGGISGFLSKLGIIKGESFDNASSSTEKATSKSTRGSRYYNWGLVSKSEENANYSGDWRSGSSYNAIWDSVLGLIGLTSDTDKVQQFLDTIPKYTANMTAIASSTGSYAKQFASAREESENKFLTQSDLEKVVAETNVEEGQYSFDKWVESALGYGIYNLGQTLADYGLTLEDVKASFEESRSIEESKIERARQLHEVQFWENVEEYNNNYFPNHFENEFLRKDWMENWEVNFLTPIRDDLHQLLMDWEDYYIHHTAYTDATASAYESAIELADLEQDEMGDSILALAQALTENSNWLQENQEILKDPVVHANVLLAQILTVTEAIMQQNNTATSGSAIPTTLLGLSTGVYD